MVMLASLAMCGESVAASRGGRQQSWPEVKCARYKQGWSDALARMGRQGLGKEFLDRHEAFIASGCLKEADVCPRSAEELELANVMVMVAMNAGTASTFPPFACK